MVSIRYRDGGIDINTGTGEYRLTEIGQVYLVLERLTRYRINSVDEQSHRAYTLALDMLQSAKDQLLRYQELKCIRNWL